MQQKTATNILKYGECLCLQHFEHLYSWWRITQTIGIPSKMQKISQGNRCSTYLRSCYPDNEMRSMEWKQLIGKTLHGSICLWLVMHKSSAFSTQRFTYSQILYCVLERWTRTLNQILHGKTDGRGFKSSPEYRALDRIDGEPMEFEWSQDSPQCSSATQSPRVTVKIERNTREIYWTDHLHVDVQRHLKGIKREQERMRVQCSTRFSLCKEIRSRTMVIPRAWIKNSGIQSVKTVHKVNGTELRRKWCWHSQKADIRSSEPRVHCPEECLKAKVVENCRYTIAPTLRRLTLFFAHFFCKSAQSLRSSRKHVWRMWILSRWNGRTRCERTIQPIVRAKCDQDKHTFEWWWSCT